MRNNNDLYISSYFYIIHVNQRTKQPTVTKEKKCKIRGGVNWGLEYCHLGYTVRMHGTVRTVSLIGGRPSVREVLSSILGDITYLFRLLSFLCSFNLPYIPLKLSIDGEREGGRGVWVK